MFMHGCRSLDGTCFVRHALCGMFLELCYIITRGYPRSISMYVEQLKRHRIVGVGGRYLYFVMYNRMTHSMSMFMHGCRSLVMTRAKSCVVRHALCGV